ncbi:MAG: prolyl oligopeptidase family serine peptidase [Candidatus Paceibacterota bacterium]
MHKIFIKECSYIEKCFEIDLKKNLNLVKSRERRGEISKALEGVQVFKIIYTIRRDFKVAGFIVVPKEGKKLPSVIHLRGGSGDFGMIKALHLLNLVSLASEGFVVITTQYPGVDGGDGKDTFGGSDDIASIKRLRDILKYIKNANPDWIGMSGHSRGGLMTYMMLREVSWVKAAVIGGASTDEVKAGKERKGWREHQISLYGKSKKELIKRSPILWANELPKKVPILLAHGSADWRVSADHSILMSNELYKNKIPHRFVLFEGADHGISEFRKEYRELTIEWFKRFLKEDRKLPDMRLHGI